MNAVKQSDRFLRSVQLTQILTQISGEDRRMLARIVERWDSLSDELKRAVLRVMVDG